MATVAIPRLPQAWIEQTRDGGQILFPLDTRNGGGLTPLLTVSGDTAEGHFLPDYGGFMPVRGQKRQDAALAAFREVADRQGAERTTALPREVATDDGASFEFFAALFTGGCDLMSFTPSGGGPVQAWVALPDGVVGVPHHRRRRHPPRRTGRPAAALGSHRGLAPAVDRPRPAAAATVRPDCDSGGAPGVAGRFRRSTPVDPATPSPNRPEGRRPVVGVDGAECDEARAPRRGRVIAGRRGDLPWRA